MSLSVSVVSWNEEDGILACLLSFHIGVGILTFKERERDDKIPTIYSHDSPATGDKEQVRFYKLNNR